MIGLRDAEAFRAKSIDMQQMIMDALDKGVAAREAQSAQLDRISALETEIASLKAWNAEKQKYELKAVGQGCVAYMLKPEARGAEPPHWLCPNCYAIGKKSFIQPSGSRSGRDKIYKCIGCGGTLATDHFISWIA